MANKKQNRYKVNIGVSYEKEVYVEADNSYDAIHTVKNILLKSNLFKFYPKDIYSILMESNIDDVGEINDCCEFNADGLQNGKYDVEMTLNGKSFNGECDLNDHFVEVLGHEDNEIICRQDCNNCPYVNRCSL